MIQWSPMGESPRGSKRVREDLDHQSEGGPGGSCKTQKRKAKEPPKFDGKMRFKDFLIQFEAIRKFNQWTDDEAVFQLFMSCQGDALAVLSANDVNPDGMTYHELVDVMKQEFGPRECEEKYFMELLR